MTDMTDLYTTLKLTEPTITLKYKLNYNALLPRLATSGSSGYDLFANESVDIPIHGVVAIKTGVFLEIPKGCEAQIRPRSGLALNHKITVLNTPGTIDSDYRGEIAVILINHGSKRYSVKAGDKIAQMVFAKVEYVYFIEDSLTETDRGSGGFGSTGV